MRTIISIAKLFWSLKIWPYLHISVNMYCPYVNCCCCFFCFFLHCLEHCKCSSAVFCTVCPYVNCLLFFCTVWSTLIRISLTKALVLWWCDNKSDLIWSSNSSDVYKGMLNIINSQCETKITLNKMSYLTCNSLNFYTSFFINHFDKH